MELDGSANAHRTDLPLDVFDHNRRVAIESCLDVPEEREGIEHRGSVLGAQGPLV